MTTFRKLPTSSACPDVDWFEHLELPTGRTFVCLRREQIPLNRVDRVNASGQVVNLARETGTDRENCQDLVNNLKVNGVLLDAQPPFIGTNNQLFDGFTRTEAIISMGITHWVFNVVEPREGFTWNDVLNEVGLGANNHPPSKAATRGDFAKALSRWIAIQETLPTQGQCVDWINNIPHSFSQEIVSNIAAKCIKNRKASESVESVDKKDVRKNSEKMIQKENANIVPLNMSGNATYYYRAVYDALELLEDPNYSPDDVVGVGYTHNIPAEDLYDARTSGIKKIERINYLFEKAFQYRSEYGKSFKLIDVHYLYPQAIGSETDLIPVDELD